MRLQNNKEPKMVDKEEDSNRSSSNSPSNGINSSNTIADQIAQRFLPDSYIRLAWDGFIFMVIWYNSVITPIRIFIMSGGTTPQALISLDVFFDFIFVADTILRFYRPYVDDNTSQIVMDPQLIRAKYLGSITFFINAVACIPIIKLPISPLLNVDQQIIVNTYFNVLRMIRVLHLPGQFQELKKFRERKGPVNEPVFRMYIILFFMLLFMCECGCLYFGLATLLVVDDICPPPEDFVDDILDEEMWVAGDSVITDVMDTRVCEAEPSVNCNDCPQTIFFTRSIYFLMQTIFTIGYGDDVVPSKSSVEMALACAFMIFGVFAYAMTIANMTSVLANLDVVNMQFRHEMDTISRWLTLRSVPIQLKQRLTAYFSYLSRSQHGMLDEVLLDELPPRLTIELAELHLDLLTKVPFFRKEKRSDMFLSMVVAALKRRIFTPGTFVLYQGELQRELVIIKSGKADIRVTGVPDAVGTLLPGDYVGDYQLLFGTTNQVGVQTAEFTEVLVLTFDAFKQVMNHAHNEHFSFSSLGYTFRHSDDEGCIETIDTTKETIKKYLSTATTILSGKGRSKLKNMMEENTITTKEFRILPNSRLHICFDIITIVAILYYTINAPVRIASYIRANAMSTYDIYFIIGYCIDLLFIVDMILRATIYSFTTHENGKSVVVSDSTAIRQKYLSSKKFKIDLFAVIPFDIISAGTGNYYALYRLPKMIRVIQIPQVISNLQRHLDASLSVKMNETQRSVLLMLLYSLLLIVWSSAGWNALRSNEGAVVSVYWAITTLSTVGYGDLTPRDFPETCYALIVGAIGAVFTAAVVANVTSFFHDAELSENNYEHKLNCIKRFMDRHKIPLESSQKVIEYFDYVGQEQDGLNEDVLLRKAIPDHISTNLLVHITQPMVGNCVFFADCESGLIRKIMVSMEQVFFGAHYTVLTTDVPSDRMYFIKKGRVELFVEKSDQTLKVVRKLDANDSFAEGCLIENWTTNPFLARTATECEMWTLKRSVFRNLIRDFPESRSSLRLTVKNDDARRRASVHNAAKAAQIARRNSARYLHPHSYFMQVWFGLILSLTLYSMIVLPFRVAFLENHEISLLWMVFDYSGDLLFFADFIFRAAFLAFYDENNNLVVGHREIWNRYVMSGKVKWHLLCAMPIEVLVFLVHTLCPLWKLQTWSLFRLNKLLRVIEMPALIRHVEFSLAKIGIKVPKNPLKVAKLLLIILLLAHLNSCVFFAIANFNQHANSGNINEQHNWANSEGLIDHSPTCPGIPVPLEIVSQQYTAGLYWAMATISTVGYGDITGDLGSMQEILYSILILLVGMMVYTLVIASLEDIVAQLDVTSSLYKMKTDKANTYAQLQCLPEYLKVKIGAYYEQLWRSHLGVKGEILMGYIPSYLKSDLITEMTTSYLQKTFFVKDCTPDVVARVMQSLDVEIYLPGDCLYRKGEQCDMLYFVYSGAIDLYTAQNVKFKTVSHCTLGESSFFMFEPHMCTAKTVDACEIFQLKMDTFLNILHEYQLEDKFKEYISVHHPVLQEAKAAIDKTIQNLSSSKMVRFLDADDGVVKVSKGVILPDSKIRVAWDSFAFFGVLYLIMSIPVEISFASTENRINFSSFLVDLVVDLFFLADIYCRLRKFAIVKDGLLVSHPKHFGKIYRRDEFNLDSVSAFPASLIGYLTSGPGRLYGIFRLFQFARAVRFGKYLEGLVEIINTRTRFIVTTATLRVCQIFIIILLLCHWFSCVFHFIGSQEDNGTGYGNVLGNQVDNDAYSTWIEADGMQDENMGRRYLRSFYWSLYTITTIGYGSVPIVSIHERVLAMVAMAVGAVICDAGLTAVLASIVANKDHQAGRNNRRIQCSKLFMTTNNVESTLQTRILEYYAFADNEMKNIAENDIINDLSSPLKTELLSHFCYDPLRECPYFDEYSDGAIYSLIKRLKPYIAIPGEHLSEIGKECHSLYIFQKGSLRSKDATGIIANVTEGAIIGHLATYATSKKEGLPTHTLQLDLISASLTRSKNGSPYVIVKNGRARARSLVQNSRNWMEKIEQKVRVGGGKKHSCDLIVKEWRRRASTTQIGKGSILVHSSPGQKNSEVETCPIFDEKGRSAGTLQLRASLTQLSEADQQSSHELSCQATSFSLCYRLDVSDERSLSTYFSNSSSDDITGRIPQNAPGRRVQHLPTVVMDDEDEEEMNRPSDLEWNTPVSFDQIIPKNTVDGNSKGKRGSVWFQDWAEVDKQTTKDR